MTPQHPDSPRAPSRWLAAVLAATLLPACADFSGITPAAVMRNEADLGLSASATPTAPIAADWWRDFGDETLNRLEAAALQDSPSLQLAQARVAGAQAFSEATAQASRPQIGAQLDATHQRYTANGAVPPPLAGAVSDSATAQFTGSWEIDFFGRNHAALDAAIGKAEAARADAQAARALLASQVARSYLHWVRLHAQHEVLSRSVAQHDDLVQRTAQRVKAGIDTELDQQQGLAALAQARQSLQALDEQVTLTRHALTALTGLNDAALPAAPALLSALKVHAPGSAIPADLLGRRADITAARWRVQAAMQDVSSARASFYPNVNLVAYAGLSSIGLDQLLQSGSVQWGVGPALRLPLFDSGALRARLRGKTAELDAAVASYNAAVIGAVRDTADQLASWQSIMRQQTEQQAAAQAAQATYASVLARYEAGVVNYLAVLNTESVLLAQRAQSVDLAARALDTEVALIHALGGGYTNNATF